MSNFLYIYKRMGKTFADNLSRNAIYLMLDTLLNSILGFIFWAIAARFYGPGDIGLAVVLISSAGLIVSISRLGIDASIMRFLSTENDRVSFINTCFTVATILAFVSSLIFLLGLDFWSPKLLYIKSSILSIIIFIMFVIISGSLLLLYNIYVSLRKSNFCLLQNFIAGLIKIPLPILFVPFFPSLGIFYSWFISILCVFLIFNFFFMKKLIPSFFLTPMLNKNTIVKIFRFSMANYVAGLANSASSLLLPIIILHFCPPEENAYYFFAFSIASILFIVPGSFSTSLYAEGAYKQDQYFLRLRKVIKQTYFVLFPSAALAIIFSGHILSLLGKNYSQNGYLVLSILALSSLFMPINSFYNTTLRIEYRLVELQLITVTITLLILLISVLLLPIMGILGVALAWLISCSINSVYVILRSWQLGRLKEILMDGVHSDGAF